MAVVVHPHDGGEQSLQAAAEPWLCGRIAAEKFEHERGDLVGALWGGMRAVLAEVLALPEVAVPPEIGPPQDRGRRRIGLHREHGLANREPAFIRIGPGIEWAVGVASVIAAGEIDEPP